MLLEGVIVIVFNGERSLLKSCVLKLKGMANMEKTDQKESILVLLMFAHNLGSLVETRTNTPSAGIVFSTVVTYMLSLLVSTFTAQVPKSSKPSGIHHGVKDVSMQTCMCA